MEFNTKMKHQFCIILVMLLMITTTITPTQLPNNIAEASPSADSLPSSPLLLDGIISSLILDIPTFDILLLTGDQSNNSERF
jgi:hypothetical protein